MNFKRKYSKSTKVLYELINKLNDELNQYWQSYIGHTEAYVRIDSVELDPVFATSEYVHIIIVYGTSMKSADFKKLSFNLPVSMLDSMYLAGYITCDWERDQL